MRYELGTLLAMGPGYVPLVVAGVLVALGVAIVVKAFVAPDVAPAPPGAKADDAAGGSDGAARGAGDDDHGSGVADRGPAATPSADDAGTAPAAVDLRTLDGRALALLTAAPLFFGATVQGLGLLPAAFGTGLLAAFARRGTGAVRALLTAAGLTLASYVIFVLLLQVRLALLGDWLGG